MTMKIIENKKLFGKINIIDICILLFLIAIFLIIYVYLGKTKANQLQTQEYNFQYEMQNVAKQTADSIKAGDKIYDNETNAYIGEVVEVEVTEYMVRTVNHETNEFVNSIFPDRYNVIITLKNNLADTGKDLKTVDDYVVKVGKRVYLRGGLYAGSGYIVYIERQAE